MLKDTDAILPGPAVILLTCPPGQELFAKLRALIQWNIYGAGRFVNQMKTICNGFEWKQTAGNSIPQCLYSAGFICVFPNMTAQTGKVLLHGVQ